MSLTILKKKSVDKNELLPNFLEISFVQPNHFNIVKETLTRMGFINELKHTIHIPCYIFFHNNKYYIVHYAEMEIYNDGIFDNLLYKSILVRNKIADELHRFGFIHYVNHERTKLWKCCGIEYEIGNEYVDFNLIPYKHKHNYSPIYFYNYQRRKLSDA